jgi:hypothetical protein
MSRVQPLEVVMKARPDLDDILAWATKEVKGIKAFSSLFFSFIK